MNADAVQQLLYASIYTVASDHNPQVELESAQFQHNFIHDKMFPTYMYLTGPAHC